MRVQNPVHLSATSEPQPDIAVVRERSYAARGPWPEDILLIVEGSDATLKGELTVKVPLYAAAGIPEVWVVDVQTRSVHRFSDPQPSGYVQSRNHAVDDTIRIALVPGRQIDIPIRQLFP